MEKVELAPGILVYKNIINGYETLVEDIEASAQTQAVSWNAASVKTGDKDETDQKIRDTDTIGVPYSNRAEEDYSSPSMTFYTSLNRIFLESIGPAERDYMSSFGISLSNHNSWDILRYGVGQQFVNHIDDHPDYHRRVSLVYYMNDNYEGGEILFPRFGLKYKPVANELLLFPSTYTYNHSVLPVIEGTRYSVVSWIH